MYGAAQDVESTRRTLETILADMSGVAKYSEEYTGSNPKAGEEKLARYSEVLQELERKENSLYYEDRITGDTIEQLNNKVYKAILRDRYINRLSWQKIAKLQHFSEARLYELHREALETIWQYIPGKNGNV